MLYANKQNVNNDANMNPPSSKDISDVTYCY